MREDGRIRFLAGNRQLQISYTQEGDTARYTCVASNVAGQAKLDIDLSIYGNYFTYYINYIHTTPSIPIYFVAHR